MKVIDEVGRPSIWLKGDSTTSQQQAELEIARKRLAVIKPLIDRKGITKAEWAEAAAAAGTGDEVVRIWLRRYEKERTLECLIPHKRGNKKGTSKLSAAQEAIIEAAIEQARAKNWDARQARDEIHAQMAAKKLKAPAKAALRKRVEAAGLGQAKRGSRAYTPLSDRHFERGYFRAVSLLIAKLGVDKETVRWLFEKGGDPKHADPADMAHFVRSGLMEDEERRKGVRLVERRGHPARTRAKEK